MASLVDAVRDLFAQVSAAATDQAERLQLLRELEDVKAVAAAAQAEVTVQFEAGVRGRRAEEGIRPQRQGDGIAAEIAIARRESPHLGQRHLGLAGALVTCLPHALAALKAGVLTERRVMAAAQVLVHLPREDVTRADRELFADQSRCASWGDKQMAAEARKVAYRLDPVGFTERMAQADKERHVGLRPAPDSLSWFSALLSVRNGVAVKVSLERLADAALAGPRARDDDRSRSQLMADGLVEKVTGLDLGVGSRAEAAPDPTVWGARGAEAERGAEGAQGAEGEPAPDGERRGQASTGGDETASDPSAGRDSDVDEALDEAEGTDETDDIDVTDDVDPTDHTGEARRTSDSPRPPKPTARPGSPGLVVNLTISDETLLRGGPDPAWLQGYGPIPAQQARDWVAQAERDARAALRRLYVSPVTGALVAMDSRARIFPRGLAWFIALRDQTCRTPWCDAPVRQTDHVRSTAGGGATEEHNGQGLCVRCNLSKEAAGWRSRPVSSPGDRHEVEVSTPHGQRATSRAPDLPPPTRQPECAEEIARIGRWPVEQMTWAQFASGRSA